MNLGTDHIVRELTAQLANLRLQVGAIEKALAALTTKPDAFTPVAPPRTRAECLREYLRANPDGARVSRVNELVAALGHKSHSKNTQYNWVYQDRDAKKWFVVNNGVVKLRPEASNLSDDNRRAAADTDGKGDQT